MLPVNVASLFPEYKKIESITFIGNYLPRRCGIATFTTHLFESVVQNATGTDCSVVAMNDRPEGYSYPSQVRFEINQNQLNEYNLVADLINLNQVDIVCIQHEYGIFGGQRGSYLIELLSNLKVPVVTTLHTLLEEPSDRERNIIVQLGKFSDRLVVMSERSVEILRDIYRVDEKKISLIHHGIPDVPLLESSGYKNKFGVSGKQILLTFGLLSPGKGIETVINALPEIVKNHPDILYMVVGATHPHTKAEHGEEYRDSLHMLAKKLGVEKHIVFYDNFVEEEDLLEFIGMADIYIIPYLNKSQIISGTLAYALGMGKAVLSTPSLHAQELLADGRGALFEFHDHPQLAREVTDLLDHPDKLRNMQQRAYDYGRKMIWSNVGNRYIETPDGWLVITHCVGPVRTYSLGIELLDLDDPTRVISRIDKPILVPNEHDRDGYVPNIIYTCGAIIFQNELIIPFASADQRCDIATLNLPKLMARLRYNKIYNGN